MTGPAEALQAIRRAVDRFVTAATAIAPADWAVAPPGGGWSPAEITERVAIANTNIVADRPVAVGVQATPTASK